MKKLKELGKGIQAAGQIEEDIMQKKAKAGEDENDGIFWISLTDLFYSFDELCVCRFFDEKWIKKSFNLEWS